MKVTRKNIFEFNQALRNKTPRAIASWAISLGKRPILTTNFGPRSASLIHLMSKVDRRIPVIWCDTGYNTFYTHDYAKGLQQNLKLNLKIYRPLSTLAQRDSRFGGIPMPADPKHKKFTEEVKLEPFRRALDEQQPDVWFTNLRRGQTAFRDTLDILSFSKEGILKVSPFYYWSDHQIDAYLAAHQLPNETKYFDPTKCFQNRECGLHG
ncbi:MAG: phosphoadenosine phosphosulfate reductase family protein [Saprospiraceae bacterium]